jgi:hypothetical protein
MDKGTSEMIEALRAAMHERFLGIQSELKDARRQLEVKDAQIAALLERVRESNAITMHSNYVSKCDNLIS